MYSCCTAYSMLTLPQTQGPHRHRGDPCSETELEVEGRVLAKLPEVVVSVLRTVAIRRRPCPGSLSGVPKAFSLRGGAPRQRLLQVPFGKGTGILSCRPRESLQVQPESVPDPCPKSGWHCFASSSVWGVCPVASFSKPVTDSTL